MKKLMVSNSNKDMKNLKRYEDFRDMVNEEGKMANIATAALMGISSLFGVAQTKDLPKNVKQILTQTTTDPVEAHHLELTGWRLTSTTIDTLWTTIPGDTIVKTIEVTLEDASFFESGAYELNDNQQSGIDDLLAQLAKDRGVLSGVRITSSTDKTPVSSRLSSNLKSDGFTGDNKGLAEARAESITKYLKNVGIDSSLFSDYDIKAEQGGEDSPKDRYVTLSCVYMCCSSTSLPRPEQTTKTVYNFERPVYKDRGEGGKKTKRSGIGITIRKKKCGKKGNYNKRADFEKCYYQ